VKSIMNDTVAAGSLGCRLKGTAVMTTSFDSDDPAGAAASLRVLVDAATGLLLRSAERLTDQQAREPSLLPGWSRGHLLTHVARNADSLRNLLVWARTGVETPQYSHPGERAEGIEAGAGRPAAELIADLASSAATLDAEAARLPDSAWAAPVRGMKGNAHPAWYTLWRRLTEVEFHHVDLDLGYAAADWPESFATNGLAKVAADFTGPHSPAVLLRCSDAPVVVQIGPAGEQPVHAVTGAVRLLLAWLAGRSAGAGLTAEPPGPLPTLPAW
jgi:maleylpyruvate isomerase